MPSFSTPAGTPRGFTYPTPRVGDIVFYELENGEVPVTDSTSLARLGVELGKTPHKDSTKFPHHKLVAITPHNEEGVYKWWYAADREHQDEYNYTFTFPYAGFTEFPRITREYLFRRDEYRPLTKGVLDPFAERGDQEFDRDNPFRNARLVDEITGQLDDPILASTYIRIQRIYDAVPSPEEQLAFNLSRTYPYAGLKTCPRLTRKFIYPRAKFEVTEKGTPDPVFENARLISETQQQIEDGVLAALYVAVIRVYDVIPSLEAQTRYNAEVTFPYYNLKTNPRYTRRYVVPRQSQALTEAETPGPLDTLLSWTHDPQHGTAVLMTSVIGRFGEPELDSLYVLATVVFDTVPEAIGTEDEPGPFTLFGYRVVYPHGSTSYPRVEWRIPVNMETYAPPASGSPCAIEKFRELTFVGEVQEGSPDEPVKGTVVRTYDKLPGPVLLSREARDPLGIPERFIDSLLVENFEQRDAASTNLSALGGNPFDDGQVISSSVAPDGGNIIIARKGQTRVKVTVSPRVSYELDGESGRVFRSTQEIVAAGTPGTDVDGNGYFSEISPLNKNFSVRTTRKATDTDTRSYSTIVEYSWPSVLQRLQFYPEIRKSENGNYVHRYVYETRLRKGYAGPCRATVTESWSKNPFTIPIPIQMIPDVVEWDLIMSAGRIEPCLHFSFHLDEIIGTNHPLFPYTVRRILFPRTNYTEWPSAIVAQDFQTPHRGGYRRKRVVVERPSL